MRPSTRTGTWSALLLICGGILAGTLFTEFALRATGYEGDYERRLFRFTGPYPLLRKESWLLREDWRGPGGLVIRGKFVAFEKPNEEGRVLFLGDSGTYGWGVPAHLNFPALFAGARADLNVINAGVYGFNTCDALRLYRESLRELRADTVVLGLFMANDINTNLLCSERLVTYPSWISGARNRLYESSAFFHFVYLNALRINNRLRWLAPLGNGEDALYPSRLHLLEPNGLHMLNYRQGELAGYLRQPGPLTEHAFALLERLLGELRDSVTADGARLVVLLIPTPPMIYGRYVAPAQPYVIDELREIGITLDPATFDLPAPTRRVLAMCARLGIACIDPTEDLKSARKQGQAVLRPLDDHPSAAGHEVLAERLGRDLRIVR